MARSKSEDKREAILAAAIRVFAERGVWLAPTSAISRAAGVAEGTLFTYFATKDALVNELYRMLKHDLADALLGDFPETAPLRGKLQHLWNRYVDWGMANPDKIKVLAQLQVSDQITAESQTIGLASFAAIERLANEGIKSGLVANHPLPFVAALFTSMVETTMAAMAAGDGEQDYRATGFEIFWRGITTI